MRWWGDMAVSSCRNLFSVYVRAAPHIQNTCGPLDQALLHAFYAVQSLRLQASPYTS